MTFDTFSEIYCPTHWATFSYSLYCIWIWTAAAVNGRTGANAFDVGGGNLNPNNAAEPGLVYDNEAADYFHLLCSLGYSEANIRAISGRKYDCPKDSNDTASDFNYPSLTVSSLVESRTIKRTVTNVGNASSSYTVSVDSPPGIRTDISPPTLVFSAVGQKWTFYVTLTKVASTKGAYSFGSYTWSDGTHSVRSPLVVKTSV